MKLRAGGECSVHPASLRLNLEKIFSNLLKLIKLFPLIVVLWQIDKIDNILLFER